jgi:hypothetical protein
MRLLGVSGDQIHHAAHLRGRQIMRHFVDYL